MNSTKETLFIHPFKAALDVIKKLTPTTAEEIAAKKITLGQNTKKIQC